jgi:hypothetical protein
MVQLFIEITLGYAHLVLPSEILGCEHLDRIIHSGGFVKTAIQRSENK